MLKLPVHALNHLRTSLHQPVEGSVPLPARESCPEHIGARKTTNWQTFQRHASGHGKQKGRAHSAVVRPPGPASWDGEDRTDALPFGIGQGEVRRGHEGFPSVLSRSILARSQKQTERSSLRASAAAPCQGWMSQFFLTPPPCAGSTRGAGESWRELMAPAPGR